MKLLKLSLRSLTFVFILILSSCNIEPFEGDIPNQLDNSIPESCEEANEKLADVGLAFSSASSSDSNYAELCNNYKKALEDLVALCGDQGGAYQLIINSLNCGEVGNDNGGGNTAGEHEFMTANINGTEYNDMKPNGYLFFPGGVSVNDFFARSDEDYILIQGNSGYRNPTLISASDREINLRVPKSLWKEGTYTLYDEYNDIDEGVCFYTFFGLNRPGIEYSRELPGEIIITKFSLEERVIQGTFKFDYMVVDESDDSESGPFKVTGTFDYALDDEFFD